ncbi:MAG: YicC family protein [Planctomycetes bacterium]|nr:YicC family protein [Planctomycetota bacterium]
MDSQAFSMTGAGFAAGDTEAGPLRIEVRTVNGRSLAVKVRTTAACAAYEAAIEEAVRERLRRGTVLVVVERQASGPGALDRRAFADAAAELRQLAAENALPPPTVADVLQRTGAAARGEAVTSRPLPTTLRGLLGQALDDLQRGRAADGAGTVQAMVEQLAAFEAQRRAAAERAPEVLAAYRARLLQRVQEFVQQHTPGPLPAVDLVREVALFGDRVDTAEELQRLDHHAAEIRNVLERGGEVGRRIEFLLQELLRETNTLGSKSPDSAIAHVVVAMKSSIDRLREQAANLE